jgi:hypothetical protein
VAPVRVESQTGLKRLKIWTRRGAFKRKMCNHKFVDGFGGMGDAVVCVKCGLDKYPEAITHLIFIAKAQGNFIQNDHTYMHFETYPFVRKFDKPITYETDHGCWTHAFNRDGELVSESEIKCICEIGFYCGRH